MATKIRGSQINKTDVLFEVSESPLSNPSEAVIYYNPSTKKFNFFDGQSWTELGSGTGDSSVSFSAVAAEALSDSFVHI